jgi:quinoprotein glucose dehydrogenase
LLRADLEGAPEEVAEIEEVPPQEPPDILYTNTGWHRFLDPDGYPAITPPWGQLTAIDLNRTEIVWQIPFGEYPELTAQGHALTGTENYGGPVVTAGGLLFIGATRDEKFRAFDKTTGEILWEFQLPAAGYATPSIYEVDGRQFVVIAAGGGKLGTRSGDAYLAFALPE